MKNSPASPTGTPTSRLWKLGAPSLGAAGLVAVLVWLPMPADTLLWRTLYDAGHAPLFGVFALLMLALLRALRPSERGQRPYWAAFVLACSAGALTELYQFFGPRDASLGDVLRDAAGAAAFLLLAWASAPSTRRAVRVWPGAVVGSLILLGLVLVPTIRVIQAYREKTSDFPTIASFDGRWERDFIVTRFAGLRVVEAPEGWADAPSRRVGLLSFSNWRYPMVAVVEVESDWSAYRTLAFEAYAEEPLTVTLRIEPLDHRPSPEYRFDREIELSGGSNAVRVPLDEVRNPDGEPLDTSRVCHVTFFLAEPRVARIYLAGLRLI